MIVVIVNIMLVGVVFPKNLQILEPHCLPIDATFSLNSTSLLLAIFCHQHHGVIQILCSINLEVLVINCSINGIIIAYLLPIKMLLHRLYVNLFFRYPHF